MNLLFLHHTRFKMMMRSVVLVMILLQCLKPCVKGQESICQSQPTCSECIRSPGCAWCKQTDFLKPGESNEFRCDSYESLKARSCNEDHVINPVKNPLTYLKNSDLSNHPENVVQLKPQNLNITLRVGVPYEFTVEFQRAQGYPIDLYYLMDLSYSMKDDLEQIKTLGQKILRKLKDITQTVRIGFGSFVDKQTLPYVRLVKVRLDNPCPRKSDICQPAFCFRNVLPLTDNAKEFEREVSKQIISGNLDSPEAGLDAIMQAAVCKDEIKWGNVTRILVYTSDDAFHMAGDGHLAGIFQPYDGQCHLNARGVYDGMSFDYPSVGHVSRVLQDNNIQLIFAVTEDIFPAYKALSALIPQSVVGVLKNDSSNVVDLISEAYGNLSSTLILEQEGSPNGLDVSYKSKCLGKHADKEWKDKGECKDVKHQKVEFQVRLNMSRCLKEPQTFRIKMQGIRDEVKVTVHTKCHCDCGAPEKSSKHCNVSGTLSCGVCSCDEGYQGQHCECVQQQNMSSTVNMLTSCRPNNITQVCNAHGSCQCGKCMCQGKYSGEYCEYHESSCEHHNKKPCNGKGACIESKCKCKENYTGSACQCLSSEDKCLTGQAVCSGQGKCVCNSCACNDGFQGEHCSTFYACTLFKDCISCLKKDDMDPSVCAGRCLNAKISHYTGHRDLPCIFQGSFSFNAKLGSDGKLLFEYADLSRSIDKTNAIIGGTVSGIIFIGIVVIIIYRALIELYDIKEYRSFLKAQEQTKWKEGQNPLYHGATTTVYNPMHEQTNELENL